MREHLRVEHEVEPEDGEEEASGGGDGGSEHLVGDGSESGV